MTGDGSVVVSGYSKGKVTAGGLAIDRPVGTLGFLVKVSEKGEIAWLRSHPAADRMAAGKDGTIVTLTGSELTWLAPDGTIAWTKNLGELGASDDATPPMDGTFDLRGVAIRGQNVVVAGMFSGKAHLDDQVFATSSTEGAIGVWTLDAGGRSKKATVIDDSKRRVVGGLAVDDEGRLLLGTLSRAEGMDGALRTRTISVTTLDAQDTQASVRSVTGCMDFTNSWKIRVGPLGGDGAGVVSFGGTTSAASFVAGLLPHGHRIVPDSVFVFAE